MHPPLTVASTCICSSVWLVSAWAYVPVRLPYGCGANECAVSFEEERWKKRNALHMNKEPLLTLKKEYSNESDKWMKRKIWQSLFLFRAIVSLVCTGSLSSLLHGNRWSGYMPYTCSMYYCYYRCFQLAIHWCSDVELELSGYQCTFFAWIISTTESYILWALERNFYFIVIPLFVQQLMMKCMLEKSLKVRITSIVQSISIMICTHLMERCCVFEPSWACLLFPFILSLSSLISFHFGDGYHLCLRTLIMSTTSLLSQLIFTAL